MDSQGNSHPSRWIVRLRASSTGLLMIDATAILPFDERWFSTALRSIGDAVIATDERGRVLFLNPVAQNLTGWSDVDAHGRVLSEVFSIVNEVTRSPVENPVDKVLATGRVFGLANHTVLIHRDGREVPIDDSAAPILDDEGRVTGVILVFRDITEKRRAEMLQEQMAAIVHSSDDIILSKSLDGTILSWNRGAERILGYSAGEVVGKHVSMLVPPDQIDDTEKILGRIRQGEAVDHYVTKRRRKDGTIIDVSLTVSPIRNAEGEVVGASKIGRDITDLRKAAEMKEQLAAIVESSDDIIASKTLDGIITSWNKGAERILGYSADEVIGNHVSMLMPPEQVEDVPRILNKIRAGKRVDHFQTRRRRKDGTIIDVSLTVSPIRDASGRIIGASKIGRDISQQRRMEDERRDANRRKDEFLAMLAHELRNPLASISNATQLFGHFQTEQDLVWAKEVILRQIKHLSRLIDDLLDVSRITRGKIQLQEEEIALAPVISSAIEAVRPLIEERKHELSISLEPGLRLKADPLRLEQILVNLVNNAAKYTDAGGRIWVTATSDARMLVIKVRDTGIGLPAQLIPHVFDLFVQGDRSAARTEGGLGIGLTLVQKLTQMHGGSVSVVSEGPGQGCEFTVRLPALESSTVGSGTRTSLPKVARGSARVMVVDDMPDTAHALTKILKLLGHDVAVAYDGPTAIEVARRTTPRSLCWTSVCPAWTATRLRVGYVGKTAAERPC